MENEKKSTFREFVNLTLLTGLAIAVVFQFNNPTKRNESNAETNTTKTIPADNILKSDTIKTTNFVQQKTR